MRRQTTVVLTSFALLWLLSGCGDDGGGSTPVDNAQIAIDIKAPVLNEHAAGDVSFAIELSHPVECEAALEVWYTEDLREDEIDAEGAWLARATEASEVVGESAEAPRAGPGGLMYTFIWNSYGDTQGGMPCGEPYASAMAMLHVRARNAESGLVNEGWQHTRVFYVNQEWITTVAGRKGVGDYWPATEAQLHHPGGVALDSDGSIYIADKDNNRIRCVSPVGIITTVAGTGTPGYSGDGGPATEAQLNHPGGVALGPDGSIYIADMYNQRIRRVSPEGIITTVAGTGTAGYSGDGGPATLAQLRYPSGVVVGPDGSIYIADTHNQRIRRVSPEGIITTVAGTGTYGYSGNGGPATEAQLNYPGGVGLGPDGSIYIADSGSNRIRRVSPEGIITTEAGTGAHGYSGDGGPATETQLNEPGGVALGSDGSIYIADSGNNRIRCVSPVGIITTVAGTGTPGYGGDGEPATEAQLYWPRGVAVGSDGSIYIVDSYNNRIRRVSLEGIITMVVGNGASLGYSGDGGPAMLAQLNRPWGVALGPDGSIYITDWGNDCIRRVSPQGIITTVAGTGTAGYSGDGGPATEAQLKDPCGVAVDPDGPIYIADAWNYRIRRVSPQGIITTVAGTGTAGYSGDGGPATEAQLNYPCSVALGPDGSIYIADYTNHRIRRVSPQGIITTVAGTGIEGYSGDGGPATEAQLNYPYGVALGSDGSIYIADMYNQRIRRVSPEGIITTVAGTGTAGYSGDGGPATEAQLNPPSAVALGLDGSIYIADTDNDRIRRVSPEGIITTVAGTGTDGYSGDGGPATEAQLNWPRGVAVGPDGSVCIADAYNHRIRRFFPTP